MRDVTVRLRQDWSGHAADAVIAVDQSTADSLIRRGVAIPATSAPQRQGRGAAPMFPPGRPVRMVLTQDWQGRARGEAVEVDGAVAALLFQSGAARRPTAEEATHAA
ncbi:hypothetical protein CCR97_18970 [Rhodoplanes elegans]|uniref:Uncharacterized protein n=1 Tax=Rhodoplanes elegans TaxID=29408 RepID=A0A327KTH9_9BRAD|nr:hypothetical protein [Rhodoplanes elegans]MBK5960267.1 hypothetical protein [Rhodoplanes elegans]RAI40715.1 hypothetical protein CH338_05355 [Rhodoplanes elegans]